MKKVDNLRKFWSEHYSCTTVGYKKRKRKVYEVEVTIQHKDDSVVDLYVEWDQIKKLAKRQDFYPIPLHPDLGWGAKVLLVRKESLYRIDKRLMMIQEKVKDHYWTLQGDLECMDIMYELRDLTKEVKIILKAIEDMQSDLDEAWKVEFFDDFLVQEMFRNYKYRIADLNNKIMHSEKIDKEIYKENRHIYDEYVF